jgi:hypothetical protein
LRFFYRLCFAAASDSGFSFKPALHRNCMIEWSTSQRNSALGLLRTVKFFLFTAIFQIRRKRAV